MPLIPTTLSIRTFEQLIGFFRENNLDGSRIRAFFTMVEQRKKMHRDILEEHGKKERFLTQTIPYNSEVEKMGLYRAPLNAAHPQSAASIAYRKLWDEIALILR